MIPIAETRGMIKDLREISFRNFLFNFDFRNKMGQLLFFILLVINLAAAQRSPSQKTQPAAPSQNWQTLNGDSPVVIARGGFTGIFPDSSSYAYQFAVSTSLPEVILYCDLQLTKDGQGLCQSEIQLDNSTTIASTYPQGGKTYNVNGKDLHGWFALDFTSDLLFNNVTLTQSFASRPSLFDGILPISAVEDVIGLKPPQFWLNVQYDMFYTQHKLSVASYIQKATRRRGIDYISSPEIGFLKSMSKFNAGKTKLIFSFLDKDLVEPTTKQKYGSILADLSSIKPLVSGILVPKDYIWPVDANHYLEGPTSLVTDAHKLGLEVYASGFANDLPASFNYTYDPIAEYLQFIDNNQFTVDGFLTDFPSTASESIDCFAHTKKNKRNSKALIISKNGASGVFPGSTDLAYQQAIDDGADIIDCSVQMSKDGVAFCFNSADLTGESNVMTTFLPRASTIPEIQSQKGIFTFDLTWSEIQTLQPQFISPSANNGLVRNPANTGKGKYLMLNEFLEMAKAKAVTGILVSIENAAYLASKKGLSITDAVAKALSNATFDKQVTQQVLIQSDDSAVLQEFKKVPTYKRVLYIKEITSSAPKPIVEQIKKFADAVNLQRPSMVQTTDFVTTGFTHIVDDMHAGNISVYVSSLRNEYTAIAIDFFSDPMVEIATYISAIGVDGIITEYPATATAFMRSPCSNPDANLPYTILPAEAGTLIGLAPPEVLPPAEAPAPPLDVADVIDPPLPPVVAVVVTAKAPATAPAGATTKSSQPANAANPGLGLVAIVVLMSLLCLGY
ncbi:glycerophosphodiester phosphodiesterase GDPDL7-like [Macadamia integrifolia]|uniref:glycerophosphodiester phosphodiesterase GDPDL7-like n=1 Tax=Macadamia integrifolia TaxID=60698 RepID=UPI001C4EDD97|nr:glycerophosphodiester phosphodiesterase GDPDL7-like [Macadamia integrifolia]